MIWLLFIPAGVCLVLWAWTAHVNRKAKEGHDLASRLDRENKFE